ncbi:MAG: proline--tRNA ligase [Dissulfurispiraceae bacterium]|jgi:prolyl-tRNA synthetase|nr:proline--tRNA ligase [Dissulfurispiraceae bacterium]
MYFSKMLIPTLRDVPADAEAISHKLMLRAGYVRQLAAGLYIYLPLALRVMNKINSILRQEMNAIDAQEITMPVLHPAEIWQKTGRWFEIKDEMFRLKDRTDRDMCLGMTHEEIMTWLAAHEIRSYRDLPQSWYQIQTKLRDEARPKSGILRTREFTMKDSYSFDADEEGLEKSYIKHAEAYHKIFNRCGLKFYQVESDPGMMGGAVAHEFMAPSAAGEDEIVICNSCGYIANIEVASSVSKSSDEINWVYEELHTPGKKSIKDVSEFLNVSPSKLLKSLLIISSEKPILLLLRGDQELHEKKIQKLIGKFRPASNNEILATLGVEPGFIGPMSHSVKIIADPALKAGMFISGANKTDYHVRGVQAEAHFKAEWHDIHVAKAGDGCPRCGETLATESVIEIGNIFKLGTKYSKPLNAVYLDNNGKEKPIIMGSYGIGPARIAAAAIEQNNDKDGIIWPKNIAPFDIQISPLNLSDKNTKDALDLIINELTQKGYDLLVDDRDERPGVKFKDADLVGIPVHIILGEKSLKEGLVEIKIRRTRESIKVKVSDAAASAIKVYSEAI